MARETLYVTNFPTEISAPEPGDEEDAPVEPPSIEEVLHELFGQYGEIETLEFGENERFEVPYALIRMSTEKAATKAMHSLNGHQIEGQRLAISYPEPDPDTIERGLSAKQRKTAESVVKTLGEDKRKPVRRIHTMLLLCGHSFVLNMLEEAQEIYEGDGMMTYAGDRKRSLGGTFFTLANWRMSDPIYRIVHHRGGKLPDYTKEDDKAIYHLIDNPHPEHVEQAGN